MFGSSCVDPVWCPEDPEDPPCLEKVNVRSWHV